MAKQNGKLASFFADRLTLPEEIIFGQSEAMQAVRRTVERTSTASVPVLILGESGTGKEIISKEIHRRSPWSQGPFVKVSCPAIPGTLLESELFGYEKGAFTGAWSSKPGRVEMAHCGTLFLDEIGEMEMSLQAKLLQLLQDGQFSRIGGQQDCQVDVRIICATNRKLEAEIAAGHFRRDLFYRINVVTINLPALRERSVDIPQLADYFLQAYSQRHNRPARPFSREVLQLLCQHTWPGNIRELENCVARYLILGSEEAIYNELSQKRVGPIPIEVAEDGSIPLKRIAKQAVREMERSLILRVLQANHWNRRKAAAVLKISYRALLYKIREAGLPRKRALSAEKKAPNPPDLAAGNDIVVPTE